MGASRFILAAGILLMNGYAGAQQETHVDSKNDRLAGPVRFVVTSRSTSRNVQLKIGEKPLPLYEEDSRTILYWPKP